MRNTRGEYFTSDIPSTTDIARTCRDVRVVPKADIGGFGGRLIRRIQRIGDGRVGHTAERGVKTAEIDIERLELGAPVVVESGLNAATHGESRARRIRRKNREGSKSRSTER